jgi:hypothetical protein
MAYIVILRRVFLNAVIERASNKSENTPIAAAIIFSTQSNGSNSRITEDKPISNVNISSSLPPIPSSLYC